MSYDVFIAFIILNTAGPASRLLFNAYCFIHRVFIRFFCVAQAGPGSFSAALQDDTRTDLNEVKGHLEIALLEKHFLREYFYWK